MSPKPGVVTVTLDPWLEVTATVEGFAVGQSNLARSVRPAARGKGLGVAAHLAVFGVPVTATGWLGRDSRSIFDRFLDEREIADRFVAVEGASRTCLRIVDPVDRQMTELELSGPRPGAADVDRLADMLSGLAGTHRWCVLSGCLPPGLPDTVPRDLVRPLVAAGQRVVVDTPGEPFRLALEARPYVVKPNLHELSEAIGRHVDTEDEILAAADELIGRGIGCVIVSMGADGAIFAEAGHRLHVRPPAVVVASTTGAGDAMVAGFVAGKLRDYGLEDCARLATASSICILGRDAERPPDLRSIEAAMADSTVRVLSGSS